MNFIKKNWGWFLALVLLTAYSYYAAKRNTDLWWKGQPLPAHFLLVRSQPDGKKFDPCVLTVNQGAVVSILPNGDFSLNESAATIHNCKFQWIEGKR